VVESVARQKQKIKKILKTRKIENVSSGITMETSQNAMGRGLERGTELLV